MLSGHRSQPSPASARERESVSGFAPDQPQAKPSIADAAVGIGAGVHAVVAYPVQGIRTDKNRSRVSSLIVAHSQEDQLT